MFGPYFEAGIRWNHSRDWGQVICQVERNGWQRSDVVYKRGGRVSQGCDGVVSVPWVLGLFRCRTPVKVEEKVRLGGDLPTCCQGGAMRGDGGNGFREACRGMVYLRRGADKS